MGDMGDDFNAMRAASKVKRANNRQSSSEFLLTRGWDFVSYNAGAHLVVVSQERIVDFWPGTGKWIARSGQKSSAFQPASGRGVLGLHRYLMRMKEAKHE